MNHDHERDPERAPDLSVTDTTLPDTAEQAVQDAVADLAAGADSNFEGSLPLALEKALQQQQLAREFVPQPVPAHVLPLAGQTVLIVGLGLSGVAAARWCARQGAALVVTDSRAEPPGRDKVQAEVPDAVWRQGFGAELLQGVDVLCVSPGLSVHQGPAAALVQVAREQGLPVVGEIELFAQALAKMAALQNYQAQVIAITGTNGKTTTTRMVEALVNRAGRKAVAAGNIAPPALDALMAALDAQAADGEPLPDVWVLELSSFQLETTSTLAPQAAAVLNITQDHLDWHPSLEQYAQAKARIFDGTTVRVVNRDDPLVAAMVPVAFGAVQDQSAEPQGKSASKSRSAKAAMPAPVDTSGIVSFGLDQPTRAGDFGLLEEGLTWLAHASPVEAGPVRGRKAAQVEAPFDLRRLMPADALRVRGRHNAANAMAALALAHGLGLPLAPLLHGLREFRGEPHRCEYITSVDGVDYIEDSKGTNVGATVAALQGLGQRVVLIAGGDGKGQDFAPLLGPVIAHARAVVVIGRDGPAIASALSAAASQGVPIAAAGSLEQAVEQAAMLAKAGDAVLLSPACASFDMFRDYLHRAEVFRSAVAERAAEAGVA